MVTIVASDGSAIKSKTSETGWECAAGFVASTYADKKLVSKCHEVKYLHAATNNIAEFTAFIMGMKAFKDVKDDHHLLLLADSQYMIDCITKWYSAWKRQEDRGDVPMTSNQTPVKNYDLIKEAHNLFFSLPSARILKISSHIKEENYEREYRKFMQTNQYSCSFEMWNVFRELNELCDSKVQKCSATKQDEVFENVVYDGN